MGRITQRFDELEAAGRKGLIAFVTAGDPTPSATVDYMQALVRGGADIIELGVPFSDPMADGPVIQRASERALAAGTTLDAVLRCVGRFRESDSSTPVVLMGYLNPFEHVGASEFAARAAGAGVDGVLVVDLPPEEADEFHDAIRAAGLDQIFLIAPTSSPGRIRRICDYASGFVYYVSVKGVTGDKAVDVDGLAARIAGMRAASALPVGIGFGIRNPEAAALAGRVADAIIVGSALVEIIEHAGGEPAGVGPRLEQFVRELRTALDGPADATSVAG